MDTQFMQLLWPDYKNGSYSAKIFCDSGSWGTGNMFAI